MTTIKAPSTAHKQFEQLVRKHTNEMARFARARVKDPDDADDLVQQAFVAAWQSMDRYAEQSSHRTWLFAILKHKLADHYRKQYRAGIKVSGSTAEGDQALEGICDMQGNWTHGPHLSEDAFVPVEERRNEQLDRALRTCLDMLPANWRSAVEMKFLLGMNGSAICAELGITDTNYWQQLHRAKVKLRGCMEGFLGSTDQ